METSQRFDAVTAFVFFLAAIPMVLGTWRYTLRQARSYSHQYAHHKARKFPLGPQLRYVVEKARNLGDGAWMYSTSW